MQEEDRHQAFAMCFRGMSFKTRGFVARLGLAVQRGFDGNVATSEGFADGDTLDGAELVLHASEEAASGVACRIEA